MNKEMRCPICHGERDLQYTHCWHCKVCGFDACAYITVTRVKGRVVKVPDIHELVECFHNRLHKFYEWYNSTSPSKMHKLAMKAKR